LPYAAVTVCGSALCERSTAAVCGEAMHSCSSLVRMQFTQPDDNACTSSCAMLQPHTGLRRHNLPCICLFMPECLCLTEAAGGWSVSAPAWYECVGACFRDKTVTRQPAAPQLLRWSWLQPAPDGAAPTASPVPPSTLWCRLAGPADAAAACGAEAWQRGRWRLARKRDVSALVRSVQAARHRSEACGHKCTIPYFERVRPYILAHF